MNSLNFAYISFISDERYLLGLKTMRESMRKVGTKYPLVAAVPSDALDSLKSSLAASGFEYVVLDETEFILNKEDFAGSLNYYYSFLRLAILKLTQYDKIVYLDSDLLFISNSDCLFDFPHFSSVVSGKCSHPTWEDPCSGLIVIEPSVEFYKDVINCYSLAKDFRLKENGHTNICDQDLFTVYKNFYWRKHEELHLSESFDCLDHEIDIVIHTLKMPFDRLHIIHMASSPKIWFRNKKTLAKNLISLFVKRKFNQLKATVYYLKLMKSVKHNKYE